MIQIYVPMSHVQYMHGNKISKWMKKYSRHGRWDYISQSITMDVRLINKFKQEFDL